MALAVLEEALKEVHKKADSMRFEQFIREAREAIGLKLYRAAELMGITASRLKNLETGYFRVLPSSNEINAMAKLYDTKFSMLEDKAKLHVKNHQRFKRTSRFEE